MSVRRAGWVLVSSLFVVTACPKGGEEKKDGKDAKDAKDAKAKDGKDAKDSKDAKDAKGDGEPTLQVADGDPGASGPVPPETSAVFFGVEGSLMPLGCFDKASKKLDAGDACLKMVAAGSDLRIASKFSSFAKKAGELVEPQCLAGAGKKVAIGVEGITEGADFVYGAWPPGVIKIVTLAADDSTTPAKTQLGDDAKAKVTAAVKAAGGEGDLQINQVAEIDLDGDGKKEKIVAGYIPDPGSDESYRWSGLLVAPGGDLAALALVDKNKGRPDTFEIRGALDLDGDGKGELWLRRQSQDGSAGDRLYTGAGYKGLGKWTCGVE